jgi:hypothetical protein
MIMPEVERFGLETLFFTLEINFIEQQTAAPIISNIKIYFNINERLGIFQEIIFYQPPGQPQTTGC